MKEEIEFGVMMNHKIFAHKTQVLFCASCPNSLIQQLNNPEDIDGYFHTDRGNERVKARMLRMHWLSFQTDLVLNLKVRVRNMLCYMLLNFSELQSCHL